MADNLTYETAQERLNEYVVQKSKERARLYATLRVQDSDDEQTARAKMELLIRKLYQWADDPLAFISDMGWAPDPKGRFGSGHIPRNLGLPPKMVPILPYPKQKELIREFKRMMDSPDESALAAVKSRQVAFTTIFMWLALWAWLFRHDGQGVVTSYDEDVIDKGGKGQRTTDSLFGRLRSFLDAVVTCIPALRFNQDAKVNRNSDQTLRSGLLGNEDITMKLTRPRWMVHGQRLFPDAEGNFLLGDIPSDSLARSQAVNFVMMDEIGQYTEKGVDRDKDAWGASLSAAKISLGWGTIPKKGGTGSFFYKLLNEENPEVNQIWIHWSDIAPYMAGAAWICRACGQHNPHPVQPGPGPDGHDRHCSTCNREQRVQYADMTSPWFVRQCNRALNDKITIAREYQMDWMAAQGDVLFSTLDSRSLVTPHPEAQGAINPSFLTIEGFDPGQSMKNSAAWICGRFDPTSQRVGIVGYWMDINPHPEYWVPFMKHWSAERTRRMPIMYGKFAGRGSFGDVFQYSDDAYRVMDLVSKYPMGDVRGDKYGSHLNAGTSIYQALSDYRIFVQWTYTKDREDLVRRGVEWATRMYIDPSLEKIEPPTPFGGRFPSIVTVFQTAKPKPSAGEAAYKLDVSKQDPPHVHNGADAWFYLVSHLRQVHAKALVSGGFAEDTAIELRDGGIDDFSF